MRALFAKKVLFKKKRFRKISAKNLFFGNMVEKQREDTSCCRDFRNISTKDLFFGNMVEIRYGKALFGRYFHIFSKRTYAEGNPAEILKDLYSIYIDFLT